MRLSEFRTAVVAEFGEAYGRTLSHDLVLGDLGGRTADEAIAAGVNTQEIWLALCRACDVPQSRRYGIGLQRPRT